MEELISALRSSPRLSQKGKLKNIWNLLPQVCKLDGRDVILGDDAAALMMKDGYLLLAAEGAYPPLLKSNPYLAGRTSVLANVNDIYAMGGRPTAIVDVIFASDLEEASEVVRGIRDNAVRYNVPVVGGHLTEGPSLSSLSIFILGKAWRLLSSFNARIDDDLVFVMSSGGKFYSGFNFWDSSSDLTGEEAVRQLEILPEIAEEGMADAGKDVSMAGLIGSILMLLECSGKGAEIYIEKIPVLSDVSLKEWLLTFPSYGFILSLRPDRTALVEKKFRQLGLLVSTIGRVTPGPRVLFVDESSKKTPFWDFSVEALIGFNDRRDGESGMRDTG